MSAENVPTSGDEAVQAAAERAKATRHLNLPQFDDLPIPAAPRAKRRRCHASSQESRSAVSTTGSFIVVRPPV